MIGGQLDAVGCCENLLHIPPGDNMQDVVRWFMQLSVHPQVGGEFVRIKTSARPFRVVARATCVNTKEHLDPNLKLETALEHALRYLGPACPPERVIRQDAFLALAIAFSLTIRRTVSPKRVCACFTRRNHQRTDLTEYGRDLLHINKAAWPPIMSPTLRQQTGDLIAAPTQIHHQADQEVLPLADAEDIFGGLAPLEPIDDYLLHSASSDVGKIAATVGYNQLGVPLSSQEDTAAFFAALSEILTA